MTDTTAILVATAIGLASGNFLFQMISDRDWSAASARSFFQILAIAAVWILVKMGRA